MTLDRYLIASMIRGGIPILGLLLGLFAFLTLAEELEDVGKGSFEVLDALRVTALSVPKIMLQLLPVTSLVGVLVGLGTLASQQELVAMRAAGSSSWQLARPVTLMALVISAAALATQQWLVPAFEQPIVDLRANAIENGPVAGEVFWTRNDHSMVRIGGVRFGLMPTDLEIHEIDAGGHLKRLLQARSANILSPAQWQLNNLQVTEIRAAGTQVTHLDRLRWDSVLSVEQMATLVSAADALPLTELVAYIRHLDSNGLDSHRYRLVLWQQLSLTLGIFGMALLGVPFVLGSTRSMAAGARISLGVIAGLLFYLLERTTGQVALLYHLPPAPLAVGPDLLITAAAIVALSRVR